MPIQILIAFPMDYASVILGKIFTRQAEAEQGRTRGRIYVESRVTKKNWSEKNIFYLILKTKTKNVLKNIVFLKIFLLRKRFWSKKSQSQK